MLLLVPIKLDMSSYRSYQLIKLAQILLSIKNATVEEAKYLVPDILFIENKLAEGTNRELFLKLIQNISNDTPIFILGNNIQDDIYRDYEKQYGFKFRIVRRFTDNFQQKVPTNTRKSTTIDRPTLSILYKS